MPVAKMTSAISGIGVANSAVVKLPISRKPGAVVPTMAPRISGVTIVPPGILSIVPYSGERSFSCGSRREVSVTVSSLSRHHEQGRHIVRVRAGSGGAHQSAGRHRWR